MATKSLNIVAGPSKWDLSLAIFDRENESGREVMFLVEDWESENPTKATVNVHITLTAVKQEDGASEGWKLEGRVTDGPKDTLKYFVTVSYDTKARKGKVELLGDGNPPEREEIHSHGFVIRKEFGRIKSVENGDSKINLGEAVLVNGLFGVPLRTRGIVVNLHDPYTSGRTSDIIDVWFEGQTCTKALKFKEIRKP